MSKEKFVVWSNLDLDLDDWRADLEDEYPGLIDDELIEKMTEINDSYIDDERANLDIVTGTEIIAIADIGRWDGRYMGYSEIKSGKISDCLYSPHDYSEWYQLRDGENEFSPFGEIAEHITINHSGSVVTKEPIDLGEYGSIIFDESNLPNFIGDEITIGQLLRDEFSMDMPDDTEDIDIG